MKKWGLPILMEGAKTKPLKPKEVTLMLHGNKKIIKHKVGLLNLAEELGNVSKFYRIMGFFRDTFYRYKTAVDEGGVNSLIDKDRRKPNLKNWADEHTKTEVVEYAIEFPVHGQVRATNELRKKGVFISPSGVRSVWLRHQISCFEDRLRALEEKMAKESLILTESQIQALKKKKQDDVVAGEIETAHRGYLGFQDTFYVDTLNTTNTTEGKLDKISKFLTFSRNLESGWTVKNDKPHYGLKEHAPVDINHRLILATLFTPSSVHDTTYLPYCALYSRHTGRNTSSGQRDSQLKITCCESESLFINSLLIRWDKLLINHSLY